MKLTWLLWRTGAVSCGVNEFLELAYADKLTKGTSSMAGLVGVALASALALFVAVAVGFNTSGGHVNPAVTFGALVGGRLSLLRALLYWIAQLLGAIVASLLLRFTTHGMVIFNPAQQTGRDAIF